VPRCTARRVERPLSLPHLW